MSKLEGVTIPNPITGQPEQAYKCAYCEGVFVSHQMQRSTHKVYCHKCGNIVNKMSRGKARARTMLGISGRRTHLREMGKLK